MKRFISKITQLKVFAIELWRELHRSAVEPDILKAKSVILQCLEMIRLRFGEGKIRPEDYYRYRLYDDELFTEKEKKLFVSQEAIPAHLWSSDWNIVANDKLIFYNLIRGLGALAPENYALFHHCRGGGQLCQLRSKAELKNFLLGDAIYPFVIKPINGIFSKDVFVIRSLSADRKRITFGDTTSGDIDKFICKIDALGERGMLIQELLVPHAVVEALCGPRVCTLRLITTPALNDGRLLHAFWKVAVGNNMADNYWRGNLIAPVDTSSGAVGRFVSGMGKDLNFHETHPDTGEQLTGVLIPDWDQVRKQCLRLTTCLSGLPIQAWDIALTNNGPTFLEVNIVGSVFLPQLANQKGFMDEKYRMVSSEVLRRIQ